MHRSSLALFCLLPSCGSRTGLPAEGLVDAGVARDATPPADVALERGPSIDAPPRVDVAVDAPQSVCPPPSLRTPLRVHTNVESGGSLASSGCSFAATWIANPGFGLQVAAATFRYLDGAWKASAATVLAHTSVNVYDSWITWDGTAYVVAWMDSGLRFARMGEDAAPIGPVVESFGSTQDSAILGVFVPADGEVRVGFLADPDKRFIYQAFFARVGGDGSAIVAPVALTPRKKDVVGSAILLSQDGSELLWDDDDGHGRQHLEITVFTDDGTVGATTELLAGDGIQTTPQGLTRRVLGRTSADYFGEWLDGSGVTVGVVTGGATPFVAVPGVRGGYGPALAALGDGSLVGVLAPTDILSPSGLELTLVSGAAVASNVPLARGVDWMDYAIGAGTGTFGAMWTTNAGDVFFIAETP